MLVVIKFGTPCSSQTRYISVPDSLTCITPNQDRFFIGQAFTIRSLKQSLELKNGEIRNHLKIEDLKDKMLDECHEQGKLYMDKFNNSESDMLVEKAKVKNLENKGKLQKVILWITVPFAGIETSIIAAWYIIKKASN